jgi:hypothetical protein
LDAKVRQDIDGEARGDQSGTSVAMSADGSLVAIGAPLSDYNNDGHHNTREGQIFRDSGHVRIYNLSIEGISSWEQVGQDFDGEADDDYSGKSVATSAAGTRVVIGGTGCHDHNGPCSGHVRIYDLVTNENVLGGRSWEKVGEDIDGEAPYDGSGTSVAMSADGNRVAIGAPNNSGRGSLSGHVRIYDLEKKVQGPSSWFSWEKVGPDIYGEAPYDYSGFSVAMSADGTRVAIAAKKNNGNGSRWREVW